MKMRISMSCILMLMLLALCPLASQAQEQTTSQQANSAVLIATVNIYDAKIVSQENNKITLSFDLSNREKAQPGVKYAVSLVKKEKDGLQALVDEKVYDEVLSLSENTTIKKEVVYEAPEYLSGTYDVWINSQNSRGLMLGLNNAGEIKLNGSNEYIEIRPSFCYLQVQGEAGDKKYDLMQGVDVNSDETLLVNCTVLNNFKTEQTVIPAFATYYRNTFGEKIQTNNQEAITLEPSSYKTLNFSIPMASKPQAYDAVLSFVDDAGKAISNKITIHYVLKGASATIQNMRLDKDYYAKGDIAKISFFATSSADNFPGSRLGATDVGKINLELAINSKNKACADVIKKELDGDIQIDLEAKINKNCPNPEVVAILKDKDGNILDQVNFKITSANAPQTVSVASKIAKDKKSVIAVLIVILLILMAILAVVINKRKNSTLLSLFVFAIIGLSIIFTGTKEVKGDTFSAGDINFVVNLDKAVYDPGATMTATGVLNTGRCGNFNLTMSLEVEINSETKNLIEEKTTNFYQSAYQGSKTFTAQTEEGDYLATFTGSKEITYYKYVDTGEVSKDCAWYLGGVKLKPCINCPSSGGSGGGSGSPSISAQWICTYTPLLTPVKVTDVDSGNLSIPYSVKNYSCSCPANSSRCPTTQKLTGNLTGSTVNNGACPTNPLCTCQCDIGYNSTGSGCALASAPPTISPASVNNPPSDPTIGGQNKLNINMGSYFSMVSTDPDNDSISYLVDWNNDGAFEDNDGNRYVSGGIVNKWKSWDSVGQYTFGVKAVDEHGAESGISTFTVTVAVAPPPATYSCINRPLNCNPCNDLKPTSGDIYYTVYDKCSAVKIPDCTCICGDGFKRSLSGNFCEPAEKPGVCGGAADRPSCKAPSDNLCGTGNSSSSVALVGANWEWNCTGADDGTVASCYTKKDCSWLETNL